MPPQPHPADDSSPGVDELARVLTVNVGSSSIRFAFFTSGTPPKRTLSGQVERVGLPGTSLRWKSTVGPPNTEGFSAGGQHEAELQRIRSMDPDHLPAEIEMIQAVQARLPDLSQVACFDTTFHAGMPRVAKLLPIPRRYEAMGVQRYGFHGLSYTFLLEELGRLDGEQAARGRVILAHLGNGASMAAVKDGRCIDTSMAFTPTAGLPMSTRSGDLDPGIYPYLARTEGMTAKQFDDMTNHHSGLLGISETSSDLRDLLAREATDTRAAEAVALFCY